jgi:carboxymethylenebutenolidase
MAVKKGEGTHEVVFSRVTIPRWGESIEGWLTRPQVRPAPGIVVVPDAWGITGFVESLCHRLSRQGYACLAVEPFSREGKPRRSAPLAEARVAFSQLPLSRLAGDVRAGVDFLRRSGDAHAGRIVVVAVGDGGPAALSFAADPSQSLRGLVLFYAPLGSRPVPPVPILGLYGANDEVVPVDEARAFSGPQVQMLVYPKGSHGFIDDERDTYEEAVAGDAWIRLLTFLESRIGGGSD